jgi:hypothetical protein
VLVAKPGALVVESLRTRSLATHRQLRALVPWLRPVSVVMHIGAGDCVLALQLAGYVERVYAVDPLEEALYRRRLPVNLRPTFSGPGGFGVQAGTVDLAFSDTLAGGRLADILRCLKAGGAYLFRPLRGQSARSLRDTLRGAGFSAVRFPAFFAVFPRKDLVAAVK